MTTTETNSPVRITIEEGFENQPEVLASAKETLERFVREIEEAEESGTISDYLEDNCGIYPTYDGIGRDADLYSVEIVLAVGGPGVNWNTDDDRVYLNWGGSKMSAPVSISAGDELESLVEDMAA